MKNKVKPIILVMCTNIGDFTVMRKILILSSALLLSVNLTSFGACSISNFGICQAEINRQELGNSSLKDRMIPNRMNNIRQPNTLMENRGMQGQTQTPENINRELFQQEATQPYNSNCQFGNCINRTNSGINNGF